MNAKIHFKQIGPNIVKRPACNPSAYDSYEWQMSGNWNEVNCKNCLRYKEQEIRTK